MTRLFGRVRWVWMLIAWTIFLWVSRLRNVLNNDELSSSGQAIRVGVVVIFVLLALAAGVGVRRSQMRIVALFLAWTVGYWLVRGIGILIDGDYSVGFKAVHTVLMAVSLTLAVLAAQQLQMRRS